MIDLSVSDGDREKEEEEEKTILRYYIQEEADGTNVNVLGDREQTQVTLDSELFVTLSFDRVWPSKLKDFGVLVNNRSPVFLLLRYLVRPDVFELKI
ncbi:hypothetical protein GJ744_006113 [Endocarpon pusillum]|uniref:Uncharacterized protein n=1 Tax=Endocarpon pusillum TaxID=364733 RepID=A0A8H7E645_9EURO|nr:hypothetical protein GJ744_006113 [Endocarpon pusillum]